MTRLLPARGLLCWEQFFLSPRHQAKGVGRLSALQEGDGVNLNPPVGQGAAAQQRGGVRAAQDDLPTVGSTKPVKEGGNRTDHVGRPPVFSLNPLLELGGHVQRGSLSAGGVAVPVFQTNQAGEGRVAQAAAVFELFQVESAIV